GCPPDLFQRSLADLARGGAPPLATSFRYHRLHQVSDPMAAPRAMAEARGPRGDAPVAALGTLPQMLASRQLAALRSGVTVDLHDVQREVDHGRVADGGPDPVGV